MFCSAFLVSCNVAYICRPYGYCCAYCIRSLHKEVKVKTHHMLSVSIIRQLKNDTIICLPMKSCYMIVAKSIVGSKLRLQENRTIHGFICFC